MWRVVALIGKFRLADEPTEPTLSDGDSGVREPTPKRPPAMSGAVALEELDEEGPGDAVSRSKV